MHHGRRTVGKIPVVLARYPSTGEILLLLKGNRMPVYLFGRSILLHSRLRRILRRGRGGRGAILGGDIVRITVIPGGLLLAILRLLAGLTRGLGNSPFLQSAAQLGFTVQRAL